MNYGRFNPYAKFRKHTLNLNDYLAIDRTILPNERTLLAYGRTVLAQVIIGGAPVRDATEETLTIEPPVPH